MYELSVNRQIALGNGTRLKDEVLATIGGVSPNELLAEAFELEVPKSEKDGPPWQQVFLDRLPGTIELEQGKNPVEPIEVINALRNPTLCVFTPVETASVDNTDAPKPAQPPAKPVKPGKKK